jgi:hypothetical protein
MEILIEPFICHCPSCLCTLENMILELDLLQHGYFLLIEEYLTNNHVALYLIVTLIFIWLLICMAFLFKEIKRSLSENRRLDVITDGLESIYRHILVKNEKSERISKLIQDNGGEIMQEDIKNENNSQKAVDELLQCCVCLDKPFDAVLLPCRHSRLCQECAYKAKEKNSCPICRSKVKNAIKIFL